MFQRGRLDRIQSNKPFAKEMLEIPIRVGKPTVNIQGNKNFADNPIKMIKAI